MTQAAETYIMPPKKGGVTMKGRIYFVDGRWYVRFGRDITRSFKDRGLAERFLTGLRFKTDEGTFDKRDYTKGNPLGFSTLANKWLDFKQNRIKPTSFAPLRNYMLQAIDAWGQTNIKVIGYAEIEDFIYQRNDISEKTRHNMVSCLGQFFKWVQRRYQIPAPEMPRVSFELGWRNIIDISTQQTIVDEVKGISYHINPKIWFGVRCLATYVSVRPGELINITEKQLDLALGAFIIPNPKEKNPKVVYLMDDDIDFIKSMPRGLPHLYFFRHPEGVSGITPGTKFGVHYLWKWWKRACQNLGIEGVDLYGGTRHSTVTALGKICTPEQVKDATGHASKAFERYFQGRQARALEVTKIIKDMNKKETRKNGNSKLYNINTGRKNGV